ncbi:MAG: hypothetical protein AAB401_03720, partial [Acidobacteriota bacterium]
MKVISSRFSLSFFILVSFLFTACNSSAPQPNATTQSGEVATTASPEAAASPSPTTVILPPLPEKFAPVEFTDVTAQAGIKFRHNNGAYGKKYLPETTGSGCAFLDYDNDGWQDVLLLNGMDF